MNLQDYLMIAFVFVVFSTSLGVIYKDIGDKELNINDDDLIQIKQSQIILELQQDNYADNLGNKNIDYSPNSDRDTTDAIESAVGLGVLSELFGVGGTFGGFPNLVKTLFPTSMTGYLYWFIGICMGIFGVFLSLEIYFTIRGSKQK